VVSDVVIRGEAALEPESSVAQQVGWGFIALYTLLVGWCLAQLFFNALLAAEVAVLPDQVPAAQRGLVAGVLGSAGFSSCSSRSR
jgi:hypothetical protein